MPKLLLCFILKFSEGGMMKKTFSRAFYISMIVCAIFSLKACLWRESTGAEDQITINAGNDLVSPSGKFVTRQEDLIGDNAGYFVIHIYDQLGKRVHTCESLYRHRDSNFILWAEDEDILWGLNGDIGNSCWVLEDENWVQYGGPMVGDDFAEDGTYIGGQKYFDTVEDGISVKKDYQEYYDELPHMKVDVPQALMKIRPKRFPVKTITVYADSDYNDKYYEYFYTVYPTPEG